MSFISLEKELGLLCHLKNLITLLRLRLIMNHLDYSSGDIPTGDGKVYFRDLWAWWRGKGWSGSHLNDLLAKGCRRGWWEVNLDPAGEKAIWYRSQESILIIEGGEPSYIRVGIPVSTISGRLREFKSAAYKNCFFWNTAKRPMTISRKRIEELTGLTAPTQRQLEAGSGLAVSVNYGLGNHYDPQEDGVFAWTRQDGTRTLARRLPNTFDNPNILIQRRKKRKRKPDNSEPTGNFRRTYFLSVNDYWENRKKAADVCWIRIMNDGKTWEWERMRTTPYVTVLGTTIRCAA